MPGALDGTTVVDLTSGLNGAYATKLLADLGASVVLVEPPGGSPLRQRPPFAPGDDTSALFRYLSGGKRSFVPDDGPTAALTPSADVVARLADLVWAADVVVVDGTSPWQAHLPGRPPHVVEVDLSPFGRRGPYAGWKGSDLATWALGGYLYFTGDPNREPLAVPGSQAELHGGTHAAFAALVGLWERRQRGLGQQVEVSDLESVLTAHAWLASSWAACGTVLPRMPNDLVKATDGWVYVMRIAPNAEIFVMIDRPDLADEDLTVDVPTWFANVERIFSGVNEWAADKSVDEIVDLGQALRVAVTPVLDARGVSDDPQLEARSWWEHDGDLRFPGQPYKLGASPAARSGPAPEVGAHGAEVGDEVAGARHRAAGVQVPAEPAGLPLAGLRVLEVTTNWAGPVAGRFLADLGAESVKVEWATRPATRALFWPGPSATDFQGQAHNRSMYFNEMNRNKRDVVVDLSKPEGREVFLELAAWADVLIENNSARVMPNLGLDWDQVRQANPSLIMVSMSGFGADGPRRDWVAYGANIETTSGLTSVTGYPDGVLSRTTLFYADPVSGIHAAVAVLAALEHRRRTGEGQWIDMSLNECGAIFGAEALVGYAATGQVPGPRGNRDPRFAPSGVYRCAGADHWAAVVVQADDEWPELALAIDRPDLAGDPGLATVDGRLARHDEIDEAVSAWTASRESYQVARHLQRVGVSAAPVLANWQMLADPHLHHRGFFQPIEHPVVGVYPTATWPWHFSRTPAQLRRPAPLFSEHNREVLREIGLTDERVEALYASGVTADEPAP